MLQRQPDLIKIDVHKQNIATDIFYVQGDSNVYELQFNITDNGTVFDLAGLTILFVAQLPDGTTIVHDSVSITDATNGLCKYSVKNSIYSQAGIINCELRLMQGTSTLTTCKFSITVVANLDTESGAVEAINNYSVLVDLNANVTEFINMNLDNKINKSTIDIDTTLSACSDDLIPSQSAVKRYVDGVKGAISDILDGLTVIPKALKDASDNIITDTYATKEELDSKASVADLNKKASNEDLSNVIENTILDQYFKTSIIPADLSYNPSTTNFALSQLDLCPNNTPICFSRVVGSINATLPSGISEGAIYYACNTDESGLFQVKNSPLDTSPITTSGILTGYQIKKAGLTAVTLTPRIDSGTGLAVTLNNSGAWNLMFNMKAVPAFANGAFRSTLAINCGATVMSTNATKNDTSIIFEGSSVTKQYSDLAVDIKIKRLSDIDDGLGYYYYLLTATIGGIMQNSNETPTTLYQGYTAILKATDITNITLFDACGGCFAQNNINFIIKKGLSM